MFINNIQVWGWHYLAQFSAEHKPLWEEGAIFTLKTTHYMRDG